MKQMSDKILLKSTYDLTANSQSNNAPSIDLVINEDSESMKIIK